MKRVTMIDNDRSVNASCQSNETSPVQHAVCQSSPGRESRLIGEIGRSAVMDYSYLGSYYDNNGLRRIVDYRNNRRHIIANPIGDED